MALTKDKLIARLQTQMGLDKHESRQIVGRLLGIMKDTLALGEDLLISGSESFQSGKRMRVGEEILKQKKV